MHSPRLIPRGLCRSGLCLGLSVQSSDPQQTGKSPLPASGLQAPFWRAALSKFQRPLQHCLAHLRPLHNAVILAAAKMVPERGSRFDPTGNIACGPDACYCGSGPSRRGPCTLSILLPSDKAPTTSGLACSETCPTLYGGAWGCLQQGRLSPGLAETATIGQPANVVAARVCAKRFLALDISLGLVSSGNRSTLFSTTQRWRVAISPTTRHSAVCACKSFGQSMSFPSAFMIC